MYETIYFFNIADFQNIYARLFVPKNQDEPVTWSLKYFSHKEFDSEGIKTACNTKSAQNLDLENLIRSNVKKVHGLTFP